MDNIIKSNTDEEEQKEKKKFKEGLYKYEKVMFIYFLVGVIGVINIVYIDTDIGDVIMSLLAPIYLYTFQLAYVTYLAMSCVGYKHKSIIMNIIDALFCLPLIPILAMDIYESSKTIFYLVGGCFSFLPMLFGLIDERRIESLQILKMCTRVLMVVFIVLIVIMLDSCSVNFG